MADQKSRRNILALMGISASAALVNTETLGVDMNFPQPGGPTLAEGSLGMQNRIADALERVAKGIRTGEIAATGLNVQSKVELNNWLSHDIHVNVEMLKG